jgi:sulfate permease, SulP family
LASVSPLLGIYSLVVAVPIGAIFISSVYMNVSTTAALSVAASDALAGMHDGQKMETLAVLVLLVGGIQLLAGLFRLGFLVRFVSNAVMTGFLNGVAVLIILGQLGHLTGFSSDYSNQVARALDFFLHLGQVNLPATMIGLLTLGGIASLLMTPLRKFAFIIALAAASALLVLLTLPGLFATADFDTVQTVGAIARIPRSWPDLAIPRPSLFFPC